MRLFTFLTGMAWKWLNIYHPCFPPAQGKFELSEMLLNIKKNFQEFEISPFGLQQLRAEDWWLSKSVVVLVYASSHLCRSCSVSVSGELLSITQWVQCQVSILWTVTVRMCSVVRPWHCNTDSNFHSLASSSKHGMHILYFQIGLDHVIWSQAVVSE